MDIMCVIINMFVQCFEPRGVGTLQISTIIIITDCFYIVLFSALGADSLRSCRVWFWISKHGAYRPQKP